MRIEVHELVQRFDRFRTRRSPARFVRTFPSTSTDGDPLPPPEEMLPPSLFRLHASSLLPLPLAPRRSPHLRLTEPHDSVVYFSLENVEEALLADGL